MPTTATITNGRGARLRVAREAGGISRADLAERLGITVGSLGDIEADRRNVSLDTANRVAKAIGCDPHSIDPDLCPLRMRR